MTDSRDFEIQSQALASANVYVLIIASLLLVDKKIGSSGGGTCNHEFITSKFFNLSSFNFSFKI